MRSVSILGATLLLVGIGSSQAQESPKPGPEHEYFKKLEGTWDATMHNQGGTSKGTMMWKVGLGGLWLLEHFKGDFGGMTFEGHGATTYDPMKKKYVGVWIDSMSTSPMTFEGTYNKEKRMLTTTGSGPGPDGKDMKMIMRTTYVDNDNVTFTMSTPAEGKEVEMFKITYKRRAK